MMKISGCSGKGKFSGMTALLLVFLIFSPTAWALSGHLNVNTATPEQLQLLPFIAETRARAILDYRHRHGGFKSLDELLASKAIGKSTFEAIKPYLSLTGPSTLRRETREGWPADSGLQVQTRIFGTLPGEIVPLEDTAYYETLHQYLQRAEHRIEIAMFLFKITDSPENRSAAILKELTAAAGRGLAVQVLLERSDYDQSLNRENNRVAKILRRNGIKVVFDNPHITTHAKLVVIDDRFCFIGSHNLTHSALVHNHEFSLLLDNRRLADELDSYITRLMMGENSK
jgi:competence ComEA-like helix-hairpin-helix protein